MVNPLTKWSTTMFKDLSKTTVGLIAVGAVAVLVGAVVVIRKACEDVVKEANTSDTNEEPANKI